MFGGNRPIAIGCLADAKQPARYLRTEATQFRKQDVSL